MRPFPPAAVRQDCRSRHPPESIPRRLRLIDVPSSPSRRPSRTPCLAASVTNPECRLCPQKSPSSPASRARRWTISPTAAGDRAGPMRFFHSRRKIAPSAIPDASSHAARSCAARSSIGLSGVEPAAGPDCWVFLRSSRYTKATKAFGPARRKSCLPAGAISLRRRPPLTKPKQSSARSRSPSSESSQVASIASSSVLVIAAFLAGRSPRLTDAGTHGQLLAGVRQTFQTMCGRQHGEAVHDAGQLPRTQIGSEADQLSDLGRQRDAA